MIASARPSTAEVPAYYLNYIGKAQGNDLPEALTAASHRLHALLDGLPLAQEEHHYAPGKWTVKEVVQHLIDAERIFAYRALRFARQDDTPLPGFEENDYVPAARCSHRTLKDLLAEHDDVRRATAALFGSFDEEALAASGTANGQRVSVLGLGWIIAGHAMHHAGILGERYLPR